MFKVKTNMADHPSSSISDYKCSICLELLVEPVELPCKHELCRPCFRHNVEEANFACPICRKRIASWARKCNREGTLVNQKKWNHIQKLFPDRCLKRLNGEADDSEDECMLNLNKVWLRVLGPDNFLLFYFTCGVCQLSSV